MGQGWHYADLCLLKSNMILTAIDRRDIVKLVKGNISKAEEEIISTMLLSEEIEDPLPESYFDLLKKKTIEGVKLKRLGFGKKEDYNIINRRLGKLKNYEFKFLEDIEKYQRLMIIDKRIIFFGVERNFFVSEYKPVIKAFIEYFISCFKEGKL